jgi:hypothetical protein
MKKLLFTLLALAFFVAAVRLPWAYWELARLVMRGEASPNLAWLVPKNYAGLVWWLMGMTFYFWVPMSVGIGGIGGSFLLVMGFRKPESGRNKPWAATRPD